MPELVKQGTKKKIWLLINNQRIINFTVYSGDLCRDSKGEYEEAMYIPTPQSGYCKLPDEEIERYFNLDYLASWQRLNSSEGGHQITLREIPDPSEMYPYACKEGKAFFIWIPNSIRYVDQLRKLVIKMKDGMTASFEED